MLAASHPRAKCAVPSCTRPVRLAIKARLCQSCKDRKNRLGDAEQTFVIKKSQLNGHVYLIEQLVKRGNSDRIEAAVREIYFSLLGATATLESQAKVTAKVGKYELVAAQSLTRVLKEVPPLLVAYTVAAVCLIEKRMGAAFRNQTVLFFAIAQAVRSKAPSAYRVSWSNKERRTRRKLQELPFRSTELIGKWLLDAYKSFAVHIHEVVQSGSNAKITSLLTEGFSPLQQTTPTTMKASPSSQD